MFISLLCYLGKVLLCTCPLSQKFRACSRETRIACFSDFSLDQPRNEHLRLSADSWEFYARQALGMNIGRNVCSPDHWPM